MSSGLERKIERKIREEGVRDPDLVEAEKQQLLHMSEISIILNDYNDIFSDFDPRPYTIRELSDDFLREVSRASLQKGTHVELKLMVPRKVRKPQQEDLIRRRIYSYFKASLAETHKEIRDGRRKGAIYVFGGLSMMMFATYLSSLASKDLLINFLKILFEPSGWFIVWTGFEYLSDSVSKKKADSDFFGKIANSRITFISY